MDGQVEHVELVGVGTGTVEGYDKYCWYEDVHAEKR